MSSEKKINPVITTISTIIFMAIVFIVFYNIGKASVYKRELRK
jgi:hypothetical protein